MDEQKLKIENVLRYVVNSVHSALKKDESGNYVDGGNIIIDLTPDDYKVFCDIVMSVNGQGGRR